jgi:hypothetical protein
MIDQDKLDFLFNHLLDKMVDEVYIDNDAFGIVFDDGTLIELYSDDDLELYYEVPKGNSSLH